MFRRISKLPIPSFAQSKKFAKNPGLDTLVANIRKHVLAQPPKRLALSRLQRQSKRDPWVAEQEQALKTELDEISLALNTLKKKYMDIKYKEYIALDRDFLEKNAFELQKSLDNGTHTPDEHAVIEAELTALQRYLNPTINKVLVLNRSTIASEYIHHLERLGFKGHIKLVCTTFDLETPAARALPEDDLIICKDYNNRDELIRIALDLEKKEGLIAVVLGIGFLSEDAPAIKMMEDAGIYILGPQSSHIALLSSKASAKHEFEKMGLTIPKSYHGDNQDREFIFQQALAIGFPGFLKKNIGGAGRGNYPVYNEDDLRAALSSVGDAPVSYEERIMNPRQFELQFLNTECIGARECSFQLNGAKNFEESLNDPEVIEAFRPIASKISQYLKRIDYSGPVTIEFLSPKPHIASKNGEELRLVATEANVRPQVERHVTEAVTGFNILEWQCRAHLNRSYLPAQKQPIMHFEELDCHSPAVLHFRFEACKPPMCDYPNEGDILFPPIQGKITKIVLPDVSHLGKIVLGVGEGSELDTTRVNHQIGYAITTASTREHAFTQMREMLKGVEFYVDGQREHFNLHFALTILNHRIANNPVIYTDAGPDLVKVYTQATSMPAESPHTPRKGH